MGDNVNTNGDVRMKASQSISMLDCPNCDKVTEMIVLSRYECLSKDDPFPCRYTLMRCTKCMHPVLMLQERFDEYVGWDEPYRLYPPLPKPTHWATPGTVCNAYSEATACLKGKAYTATAIMCRKTIECVCKENGASGKDLKQRIQALKDKGVIEQNLFEWADALRMLGNDAAHEPETSFNKQDALDMLEFTDALLGYIYTFKERFNQFMTRRSKSKANSK